MIFPKSYYVKLSYLTLQDDPISGKPIPVSPKEPKLNLPRCSLTKNVKINNFWSQEF